MSSPSLASLLQYAVLGLVGYILAGAPLLTLLTGEPASSYSRAGARAGHDGDGGTTTASARGSRFEGLVFPEGNLSCGGGDQQQQEHGFKGIHVLAREPLVVYIEGFLTAGEMGHLLGVSDPLFTPSTIWTASSESFNPSIRNSEKAPLPRDQTVKCIEERARRFQGWRPYTFVEKLWAQRYGPGGHYTYHYDWSTATRKAGRVSSFMVYVAANCTGGGTHFPRLEKPVGREWCRFIECEEEEEEMEGKGGIEGKKEEEQGKGKEMVNGDGKKEKKKSRSYVDKEGREVDLKQGVIFKPIAGNAVFWENMRSDGSGYLESWHAGLPVESGVKVGLNIWSWFQEGLVSPVDGQKRE